MSFGVKGVWGEVGAGGWGGGRGVGSAGCGGCCRGGEVCKLPAWLGWLGGGVEVGVGMGMGGDGAGGGAEVAAGWGVEGACIPTENKQVCSNRKIHCTLFVHSQPLT